jgi:hypothetical protein
MKVETNIEIVDSLCNIIMYVEDLQELNLSGSSLSANELMMIGEALVTNAGLRHLDLSYIDALCTLGAK